MELAMARNPVERTPTSLVRYLGKAGMLSETALYGVLCAVQFGPGLERAHATKLQVAVLQCFARRGGGALGMSGSGARRLHSCAHVGVEFRLYPLLGRGALSFGWSLASLPAPASQTGRHLQSGPHLPLSLIPLRVGLYFHWPGLLSHAVRAHY